MLVSVTGTLSRKWLDCSFSYKLISRTAVPPPGSPKKVARDTMGVYGNGQAPCSIITKVLSLLAFTLGEPLPPSLPIEYLMFGIDLAKTFLTPSTKSSYVPFPCWVNLKVED